MMLASRQLRLLIGRCSLATPSTRTLTSASASDEKSRSVLISQSHDIFSNLALEDWLYRHLDVSTRDVLFIWSNDPCVVIGRHQNPWTEANFRFLRDRNIPLARRNSGGGTVYHDRGNLCLTFFSAREDYDREGNLGMVAEAVKDAFGIDLAVNQRQDIEVLGKKVSGTAAKLASKKAYHHCTLLVNADRENLRAALDNKESKSCISSTATASVPSPIANLSDFFLPGLTVPDVISVVGDSFLARGTPLGQDKMGYQFVRPDPFWYSGIDQIRAEFASWDWIYGRTPDFKYEKAFHVPDIGDIQVNMKVSKGEIQELATTSKGKCSELSTALQALQGQRYVDGLVEETVAAILSAKKNGNSHNSEDFVTRSHLPGSSTLPGSMAVTKASKDQFHQVLSNRKERNRKALLFMV